MAQDILKEDSIWDTFINIHTSSAFQLIDSSFIVHIPVFICYLYIKWQVVSIHNLSWWVSVLTKYIVFFVGICSEILTIQSILEVVNNNSNQADVLLAYGFVLSGLAALVAYGTTGRPSLWVGILAAMQGTYASWAGIVTVYRREIGLSLLLRIVVGIFHYFLGITCIFANLPLPEQAPGVPWPIGNGIPHPHIH